VLSPSERRLRATIGAHALHAQRDPLETTAKARAAAEARFIDQGDPERILPEAERLRRAASARKQYFAALSLKSARARRKARAS